MNQADRIAAHIEKMVFNALDSSLERIGKEIEADVVDWLDANDHVVGVAGEPLRNTIVSISEHTLAGVELKIGTNRSYAVYLHEGTRPHWPPIDAIRLWVLQKFNLRKDALEKRARQVQVAISRKGTKAAPFLKEPFNEYRPQLMPRLVRYFKAKMRAQ